MYVNLPQDYRFILFQLAFLEFGTINNITKFLKEKGLASNVSHWRNGKDYQNEQLTNLEALLVLIKYTKLRRNKIFRVYQSLMNEKSHNERFNKSKNLVYLLKTARYIFGGNDKFSKLININPGTLRHYLHNKKFKSVSSKLVFDLLKLIENKILIYSFSYEELEKNILSYKSRIGKEIIPEFNEERKLPIRITPEFESIIYHLMGDGYVSEIGSSEYTQINPLSKNNFLQKLFRTFGYFKISEEGFNKGRVYISKTIIKIICNYYKLNSHEFKWNTSKLPDICFKRDSKFKLAGLIAFIVDEAYIGKSNITLHSSNKKLLSQIRQMTLDLKLACGEIKLKKGRGTTKNSFRFNILKESIERFVTKSEKLEKIYATCNLSQKRENILKIVN